jgi:hypothetical protein
MTLDAILAREARLAKSFITLEDAVSLEPILRAAQRGERIVRIDRDRRAVWATAKRIAPAFGDGPFPSDANLLDGFLEVEVTRIVRPLAGETPVADSGPRSQFGDYRKWTHRHQRWPIRELVKVVPYGCFVPADSDFLEWHYPSQMAVNDG